MCHRKSRLTFGPWYLVMEVLVIIKILCGIYDKSKSKSHGVSFWDSGTRQCHPQWIMMYFSKTSSWNVTDPFKTDLYLTTDPPPSIWILLAPSIHEDEQAQQQSLEWKCYIWNGGWRGPESTSKLHDQVPSHPSRYISNHPCSLLMKQGRGGGCPNGKLKE